MTICNKFKYICSKCVSDNSVWKYRSSFEYSKFTCPYDGVDHYEHLNVKDLKKIRIIKFLEFETKFFDIEEKNENDIFDLEDTIEKLKSKIETKVNKLKEQ